MSYVARSRTPLRPLPQDHRHSGSRARWSLRCALLAAALSTLVTAHAEWTNSTTFDNGSDLSNLRESVAGSNTVNPANGGTLTPSAQFTLPSGYDTSAQTGSLLSEVAAMRRNSEWCVRLQVVIIGLLGFSVFISKVHF